MEFVWVIFSAVALSVVLSVGISIVSVLEKIANLLFEVRDRLP